MTVLLLTSPPVYIMTLSVLSGIPTDEEQATGLEKIIMKAMKEGTVSFFVGYLREYLLDTFILLNTKLAIQCQSCPCFRVRVECGTIKKQTGALKLEFKSLIYLVTKKGIKCVLQMCYFTI